MTTTIANETFTTQASVQRRCDAIKEASTNGVPIEGADFTFLGRSFMYAICALGAQGGPQVMTMLLRQLQQVMEQLGCARVSDLPEHRVAALQAP